MAGFFCMLHVEDILLLKLEMFAGSLDLSVPCVSELKVYVLSVKDK